MRRKLVVRGNDIIGFFIDGTDDVRDFIEETDPLFTGLVL